MSAGDGGGRSDSADDDRAAPDALAATPEPLGPRASAAATPAPGEPRARRGSGALSADDIGNAHTRASTGETSPGDEPRARRGSGALSADDIGNAPTRAPTGETSPGHEPRARRGSGALSADDIGTTPTRAPTSETSPGDEPRARRGSGALSADDIGNAPTRASTGDEPRARRGSGALSADDIGTAATRTPTGETSPGEGRRARLGSGRLSNTDVARTGRDPAASQPTLAAEASHDPTLAAPITPAPSGTEGTVAASVVPSRETALTGAKSLTVVERSHYDVLGEFGRGGLGRVLRARDRRTGRIVAVKEALHATPALAIRFAREALVTANLQHPSIVPVYEVGRWPNGEPFYAMKLVAGRSLAEAAHAATSLHDRLALLPHVTAVADALAYAHGEQVIHRDLKPANVLLGDYGETVVIDWGLAKRLGDPDAEDADDALGSTRHGGGNEGETAIGSVLGTPGYMAPEQARGEPADERADVFAIGAMLYEVLSSARPYSDSKQVSEVLDRAAHEPPRPLGQLAPDTPAELLAIVDRAMAFEPERRYPTAKELAEDLRRYQTGQLVGAHQYTAWQLVRRWVRRHRGIVAISAAALVVLAVVGTISIRRVRTERDHAMAEGRRAETAMHDAMRAKQAAEDQSAALAEEQGRRLAVGGDAPRALPYLAAAVAKGRSSPGLAFVLARALEQSDPVEAVLVASKQPLTSVSYSPDGAQLVAAGADNEIRIWDAHSHALVRSVAPGIWASWLAEGIVTLQGDGTLQLVTPRGDVVRTWKTRGTVSATAISSDHRDVAVGTSTGAVLVYAMDRDAPLAETALHSAAVATLAFSPDGTRLASAGEDATVTVLQVAGAKRLFTRTLGEVANGLGFSSDGKRLATGDRGGTTAVWDATSGRTLVALVGHANSVESVAFDQTGTHLVTASADRTAGVWDLASGTRTATLDAGFNVAGAELSPDGTQIATFTDHGDVALWSADGAPLATLAGHVGAVSSVAFSADGSQLATVGLDGDLRLWHTQVHRSIIPLSDGGAVSWRGEWSPDGTRIATTAKDGVARVFDGETGALVHELRGHGGEVTRVAFSPDSRRVATSSVDGTARVWDVATGRELAVLRATATNPGAKDASPRVRYVGYSPDGASVVTTHGDGLARIWDVASGQVRTTLKPVRGQPRSAIWSPDGTRIVTPLDPGGGATLWRSDGTLLGEAELEGEYAIDAAWSADGTSFVVGGDRALVRTFDGTTGRVRDELRGHTIGPVMSAQIGPDGRVLTAGAEGIARMWRGTTTQLLLGDGSFNMLDATLRPDGALAVTVDADARVWDTSSGELVAELRGTRDVTNGAFCEAHWSPDGTRLLLLNLSASPRLWHVPAWSGTADDLQKRLRCTARWRLDGSRLVLATPEASACK